MKTCAYFLISMAVVIFFCGTLFAIPPQDDFYHKYYKIESKGFSGKVLTRIDKGNIYVGNSVLGDDYISLAYDYTNNPRQKWIIAPVSGNDNEFYIINAETGNPLMINETEILSNNSSLTENRQRFKFTNINGEYFQIQSVVATGCFYGFERNLYGTTGEKTGVYDMLGFNTSQVNDDYSYFKMTEVGDIPGSGNVLANNLVYQPGLLFNIPEPPVMTSYTASSPLYSEETVIGETWIPFTLVHDDSYSRSSQIAGTPFYKIIRTQSWKKIQDFSYEHGFQLTTKYQKHSGITQAERDMTNAVLDHSWSEDGTAEFTHLNTKQALGIAYMDRFSIPSVLVNKYSSNAYSEMDESLQLNAQGSIRYVVYELVDRYYLKRMDGKDVISPVEIFYPQYCKLRTWSSSPIRVFENPTTHTTTISDGYTPLNFSIGTNNGHPYLQWNASALPDLANYEVWKKKDGNWLLKGKTINTCYTDADETVIAPDTSVCYKIRAVNQTGWNTCFTNETWILPKSDTCKVNQNNKDAAQTYSQPASLKVEQNYPNPFNPSTTISFSLSDAGNVSVQVFEVTGRLVATLFDGYLEAGNHKINFNAQKLSSGIYLYKISAGKGTVVKSMLLIK